MKRQLITTNIWNYVGDNNLYLYTTYFNVYNVSIYYIVSLLKESRRKFTDAIVKYALDNNSIRNNIHEVLYFSKFHFVISIFYSGTYVLYIMCVYIYKQQWLYKNNNIFVRHQSYVDRNRRIEIFLTVCLCENKEPTRFSLLVFWPSAIGAVSVQY